MSPAAWSALEALAADRGIPQNRVIEEMIMGTGTTWRNPDGGVNTTSDSLRIHLDKNGTGHPGEWLVMASRGRPAIPPDQRRKVQGVSLSPQAWGHLAQMSAERGSPASIILESLIESEYSAMPYTVRRPISSDHDLLREGTIVSRHESLNAAVKALRGQQVGAQRQGGYSQDYVWDDARGDMADLGPCPLCGTRAFPGPCLEPYDCPTCAKTIDA